MTLEDKQLEVEKVAEGLAISRYHRELTNAIAQGRFDDTKAGKSLMQVMYLPLNSKIAEYLGTTYKANLKNTQNYIKLISDDSSEITYILLKTLVVEIAKRNNLIKLSTLAVEIIRNLKKLHYFNRLKDDNPKLHAYLGNEYRRASSRRKELLISKHLQDLKDTSSLTNEVSDVKAGTQLLEVVMLSGLGIIEKTRRATSVNKPAYCLSFTQETLDILFNSNSRDLDNATSPMLPMMCKPRDWETLTKGGYLYKKLTLVKTRSKKDRMFLKTQDFSKIFPKINKLQQTAWRVNTRVADIINDIVENNMIDPTSPPTLPRCYGGLPSSNRLDVNDLMPYIEYKEFPTKEEKDAWHIWNKKREAIKIGLDGEVGRRLQFALTMEVMRNVIDYERFYYVYQLDYRGRVYPHTDFFNPQSKGYTKAMLEFADGYYLNDVGIYWLKIHSANCYGLDKEPFEDRIKWAESNTQLILEIAKDPMSNLKEWVQCDSPFEFLAACYALQDHIEGKKVHLPIQLDAVNSGIQFYSGLLLDKEGAESCCVIGNTRSDLYKLVANRVNDKLANKDYEHLIVFNNSEGVEKSIGTGVEARSLEGKVTRSMTKKNVMTVPYSVTIKGMRDQNWDTMDEMKLEGKKFWEGDEWVVNTLLTNLIHSSIFEIVKGALIGQEYMKEVAKLLEDAAVWHTPLYDFPVRQHVLQKQELRIRTVLGRLSIYGDSDILSKKKQLSGIAANYIHSIDSTLLMYCVEHMSSDLGVIHDCFLVHPNNGEEIRKHYKEGYVAIMRSNPLHKFSKELDPEGVVPIPCIGTLDLNDVLDSKYIIS